MNATTSADFYKSEHNSNYIWHNTMAVDSVRKEDILKSEIKDKRLGKMKDAFKALAMRRWYCWLLIITIGSYMVDYLILADIIKLLLLTWELKDSSSC